MSDYQRIAQAIEFIRNNVSNQPSLDEIANNSHLSVFHFQRLFSRWTGITPKRFLQILSVERAKQLLLESKSVLEVADKVGFSSGSRLYDHFINLEAVTPGEYKQQGFGVTIEYAVHQSPFGNIFIAITPRGINRLCFLDSSDIETPLQELQTSWPMAELQENKKSTQAIVDILFNQNTNPDKPLSLYVTGTNFQISVWKALLRIPPGVIVSYSQIAQAIGSPRAARAVGTALAANPAAFIIPCHRVIQQSGKLGGYHWGETRLLAIHAWESARNES